MRTVRFTALDQVASSLHEVAQASASVTLRQHDQKGKYLEGIRKAKDPLIRKAYQTQLRAFRKQQRETRERNKILAWARGDNWGFSNQTKMPARLKQPPDLDGETDRGKWGNHLGAYLRTLYSTTQEEVEAIHTQLTRIHRKATQHSHEPLECVPNELRDLVRGLPARKAAGPDGIPSQLLKALHFKQICELATLFTHLANHLDYRPGERPEIWNSTLAILLPKESGASTLDRHRAISLMCQLQKLYSKWLLAMMTWRLDPCISENQAGFRRQRQASEIMQVVSKLIELAAEWKQHLTLVRLDMRKAFDRLKQSAILDMLAESPLPAKVAFNAAREMIGAKMFPCLYGCAPEEPVPLEQGTKQGAPESGLYFVATLQRALQPLAQEWDRRGEGCPLQDTLLTHLIFADDLILVGPSPRQVAKMLHETEAHLSPVGLQLNPDKTAYLTTQPAHAQCLPGKNANATGLKILGRTFTLQENTAQDMDNKIAGAWGRFHTDTSLPHRIRIFRACVGQALLWAAETWHITRRRLQRIRGVELAMLKALIPCPPMPPHSTVGERCEAHKKHVRHTLRQLKYEGLDRAWVRKYFSWAGHLARLPEQRLAARA